MSPRAERVLQLVRFVGPLTAREVRQAADDLDMTPAQVNGAIGELAELGSIETVKRQEFHTAKAEKAWAVPSG